MHKEKLKKGSLSQNIFDSTKYPQLTIEAQYIFHRLLYGYTDR
jgi:hypothetical protein